jgi:hypothetical protein
MWARMTSSEKYAVSLPTPRFIDQRAKRTAGYKGRTRNHSGLCEYSNEFVGVSAR